MARNIEIKETIADKNSDFNVKRFRINNLEIDRPIKVIDAKNLTKKALNLEKKQFSNIVLGTSRLISPKTIKHVLGETDDKKIKETFDFEEYLSEYPYFISQTFRFNPFKEFGKIENISGYFNYYYQYSNPFLFVPNVKIDRYIFEVTPGTAKKKLVRETLISIDEYLRFVNEVYQIINRRNKKAIFVPVSLKLAIDDTKKLAKEYIKNEYFNIWFDFEGSAINKQKRARIRAFFDEFEDNQRIKDILVYSTNIKRELLSNIKADTSPASDILASLVGSNIVGVNKEPQRFQELRELTPIEIIKQKKHELELKRHKSRIFNASTYYYKKHAPLMDPKENSILNSALLDRELAFQTEHFLKEYSVKEYITQKPMIVEYRGGELAKDLFSKKQTKIDWF